jgi:hypothetical protein
LEVQPHALIADDCISSSSDDISRVLEDVGASDANAPLTTCFSSRKLLAAQDLDAVSALAARASHVHESADSAVAFVTTQWPAPTAPCLASPPGPGRAPAWRPTTREGFLSASRGGAA